MAAASRFHVWLERLGRRHHRSAAETGAPSDQEPPSPTATPANAAVAAAGRQFYSRWIGPGALVFDVGANIGERSKIFLELGARVVAVEPQPRCAQVLRELGDNNLVVEEVALGNGPGTSTLRIASETTISSMADDWIDRVRRSGRFAAYSWPETISVEVSTLDTLIDRHGRPDFCKIDVEGYEPEVVRGLSQPLPVLSFEFANECADRADATLARLDELGFERFNFSHEETLTLVWDTWRDLGSLKAYLASLSNEPLAWGDIYAAD